MVDENLLTVFVCIGTEIDVVTLFVVIVVISDVVLPETERTGAVVVSDNEDLGGVETVTVELGLIISVVNKDVVPVDDVLVDDDTLASVDVVADCGKPVGIDVDSEADVTVDDVVDVEVDDGVVVAVVVEVVVVDVVEPEQLYNLTSSMAMSLM